MGLLQWIVAGFGWEVGKTAAKEAIEAARQPEAEPIVESPKEREKREKKAGKAREKEARRRAKAIDDELAALKKRVR